MTEGLTPRSIKAFRAFRRAVDAAYGFRVSEMAVFGSRACGDARPASDLDVVVVLWGEEFDVYREKMRMADLAYDAIVETGVHMQYWPVSKDAWEGHVSHSNPALVQAMHCDAVRV